MADLEDQLRAYGQQLRQDRVVPEVPEGPTPSMPELPAQVRPRAYRWFLVAAATAAVVAAASLMAPAALREGDLMNRKSSGVVLGFCLVTVACTNNAVGSDPTTSDSPTTQVSSTATAPTGSVPPPLFENAGDIEPGTYTVDRFGTPIQVTVPAGWVSSPDYYAVGGQDSSFLAFPDITEVRTDSCQYVDKSVAIGPTVDDLVTALVAQENTDTTDPRPIELDGFTGVELDVSSPPAIDVKTTCYGGSRGVWSDGSTDVDGTVGTPVTVRVLDLNGRRAVIVSGSYEPMSDQVRAEMTAMVDSLEIG